MKRIRINVGYNERSNTLYYRDFKVVDTLPSVGDDYEDNGQITEIVELDKDPEQPTLEARDMDCYLVKYRMDDDTDQSEEDDDEDEEPEEYEDYIAISSTEPNHMEPVLIFDGVLPPTVEIASQILLDALKTEEGQKSQIEDSLAMYVENPEEDESLLETFFGITPEVYESVIRSVFIGSAQKTLLSVDGNAVLFEAQLGGLGIYMEVPYWWTRDKCLYIYSKNVDEDQLPPRTIHDLSPAVLDKIIGDALEMGETWFEEEMNPVWFDLISMKTDEVVSICQQITDICYQPFKDFMKSLGYTQAAFARRYYLPKRTVQDWCLGRTPCRAYLRLMFAELEGLLPHRKSKDND